MQPTENNPPEKFNSFDKNGYTSSILPSPRSPRCAVQCKVSSPDQKSRCSSVDRRNNDDAEEEFPSSSCTTPTLEGPDVEQVSEDIDRFTDSLTAAADDKSNPPEVPHSVEAFSKIIESRIAKYNNSGETRNRVIKKMTEEDAFFIEAVMRISKLTNAFSEFPPSSSTASDSLNRTSLVLQKAMAFLEEELRFLLVDSKMIPPPSPADSNPNHKRITKNSSFSFDNNAKEKESSDHRQVTEPDHHPESSICDQDDFPGYSPDVLTKISRIVSAMISGGYEKECCQVYSISRRSIFNEQLKTLEYEKLNMDDVWRMSWESLQGEIKRWLNIVKNCSETLFPAEKQLGETIFPYHPSISTSIFSNLARSVVIQLLDFAGAVSMTKRSAEKLFKFLDMYETLLDLIPAITDSCSDDCEHELRSEISAAAYRLGEAAMNIFLDLENSIKNDVAKTAVPGGAVHPLTRYVLNYLKYVCEYKGSLEKIFEKAATSDQSLSDWNSTNTTYVESEVESPHNLEDEGSTSRFSVQVVTVMELLDSNLESKSMLYKDPSLRYIFLMNNGRYILQKVKGSTEIHQVMGDNWCRRRSTIVRQFHKNYQRETWVRFLHSLSHEGLLVNGKINKPMLKERFKNFNTMFEEIHKIQSTWVVSDEQLRTELRLSISAVVIPAYRSFLGRFRQYLDTSKQAEKYIKYQPEDIEALIEELFDGNPTSMARRRT